MDAVHDHRRLLVAPGGAVLALAPAGDGRLWVASEAGLWVGRPGAWGPTPTPPPLTRANALLVVGDPPIHFAGGAPAAIAYSLDDGATWQLARTDEVETPVTCLVASPRFAADRSLLAGTAGAGILRSTDGGRSWRLCNAGLEEFSVLALAVAPVWDEHEHAFALTEGGFYHSPNGGRYWRRVADCGAALPLQALAVSPDFAAQGAIFAAGELDGVLSSTDFGRSWAHPGPVTAPADVNCLLARAGGALLAGTADGAIWHCTAPGAPWRPVATAHSSVLALAQAGAAVVAGLLDDGLLRSADGGLTWAPEAGLGLRDLTRLAVAPDGTPLAFGPTGGVWHSAGDGWARLALDATPLTALQALPGGPLIVATGEGLVLLVGPAGDAAVPAPGGAPITALAAHNGAVWLGDARGGLWHGPPGGPWSPVASPAAGSALLGLLADGPSLIIAAAGERRDEVRLWRSADAGATWAPWLQAEAEPLRVCFAEGEPGLVGAGRRVWRREGAGWAWGEPDGRPVVALRCAPDGSLIVATAGGAYRQAPATWERLVLEPPPGGLLDLVVLPTGHLLGLGPGGSLTTGTLDRR